MMYSKVGELIFFAVCAALLGFAAVMFIAAATIEAVPEAIEQQETTE